MGALGSFGNFHACGVDGAWVRGCSPADGATFSSSEITLRYSVRTPSGEPVTGVRVLVDGRPLPAARWLAFEPSSSDVQEMRIPLPPKDSEVSLVAENRFATSEPASVRLHWQGAAQEFVIRPKLYILAVGISAYPEPNRLNLPAKDARDFVDVLKAQEGRLYREVEVKLLTDQQATRDEIVDGLDWIEKSTTQHDVAMVFLAGHGVNDTNGIYYFLPANFQADKLKRTAVAFSDIKNTVQALAGKVLFFVDTCHAGNVMGSRTRGLGPDINAVVNELASAENGAVVFTASSGNQVAMEKDSWGNGAFTKALVEGLSGKADYQGTGKITINMLDLYISERVKELTGGRQTPTTTKPQTIPDFPVAVLR